MSNIFDKLSQEWWKLDGAFKALHSFNYARVTLINDIVKNEIKKKKKEISLLDVGCGGGIFCEPLARVGYQVHGIDTNDKAIKIAKHHSKKSRLNICYNNSEISLFDSKKKFDIITCMEVLEHTNDPNVIISEVKKRLKPGGYFIGSTINKTIESYLFAIIIAENFLSLIPKGTHDWKSFIRPNKLKKILLWNGLSQFNKYGVSYNPMLNNWKFHNSCQVNYMFSSKFEN